MLLADVFAIRSAVQIVKRNPKGGTCPLGAPGASLAGRLEPGWSLALPGELPGELPGVRLLIYANL
jgi:hypothetical protein